MISYKPKAPPRQRSSLSAAVTGKTESSVIELSSQTGGALSLEQVQVVLDRLEETGLISAKVIQTRKSKSRVMRVDLAGKIMRFSGKLGGAELKTPTYVNLVLSRKPFKFQSTVIDPLAQALVDDAPIKRTDPLEDKLKGRAVQRIMDGTAWLTAKEVGERIAGDVKNPHSTPTRLLSANRIFAITRRGTREFPAYQFDEFGMPIPAVHDILELFEGLSSFQIASWFESTSSMLGGKRPRELLSAHPEAVIQAAKAHVEGPAHG